MRPFHLVILVLLQLLASLSPLSRASPGGAPLSTCETLMPVHQSLPAQSSPSPYQLYPSGGQGRIKLLLGSPEGLGYEGFIIMARDLATGEIVGEFAKPADNTSRHLECTPGVKNAITHTAPQKLHNLELDWDAPPDYVGDIVFNSTFCKTWDVFWVGVESPRITVQKRSIEIHSTTPPPLSFSPNATTPPYFSSTAETQDAGELSFYEGCGTTKNCFGTPDDCVGQRNCKAVVSVLVEGERYIFEMQSRGGAKYVSVGLSEDEKMGDDSVVECVNKGDQVGIYMSWNNGKKNQRIIPTPPDAIKLLSGSIRDDVITCKFSRNKSTVIQKREFDLVSKPYHLLVAVGGSIHDNNIGYHDIARASSGEPKLLADVGNLASASDLLVRLHGALMIASWIGTASVGMLLARYYRQTWVNSQLCGVDQWFAWHRFFMFLTWLMTIGAFVLIFVELGEWSSATYHASFGLATTILCFVQPFMAAMRPHPGAPKRSLFNWAHWFVGNAAQICGIIAIFFAVRLTKAKLPEWVDWILVAYVVFHVLTHLLLTFAGCASDKQGSQRVNSFPMKDVHARNSMTHPDSRRDAAHSGLRKTTFALYFLAIVIFAAALVVITVLAPIKDSWNAFTDNLKSY